MGKIKREKLPAYVGHLCENAFPDRQSSERNAGMPDGKEGPSVLGEERPLAHAKLTRAHVVVKSAAGL